MNNDRTNSHHPGIEAGKSKDIDASSRGNEQQALTEKQRQNNQKRKKNQ